MRGTARTVMLDIGEERNEADGAAPPQPFGPMGVCHPLAKGLST